MRLKTASKLKRAESSNILERIQKRSAPPQRDLIRTLHPKDKSSLSFGLPMSSVSKRLLVPTCPSLPICPPMSLKCSKISRSLEDCKSIISSKQMNQITILVSESHHLNLSKQNRMRQFLLPAPLIFIRLKENTIAISIRRFI